jgi:hypothetical protein
MAYSKSIIGVGELDPERGHVNDCAVDEVLRRHREIDTPLKNTYAFVPGFVFSWARANIKFGVGYGDVFLPGISLVVPGAFPRAGTPTPVVEFDVFVRF